MSNTFADKSFANLETIVITGAGLYYIQDFAFNGTHQLKKMEITNIQGPTVLGQYSLYGLDDLQSFEASGVKNLQSIGGGTFSATPSLKTLKLQGNDIKFIHSEALDSVYGLEHFDISNNPDLTSIPQTLLSQIDTLRTIYMNDCSLSTLYTDYFYASYMTNALQEFRSNGNSWNCNEDMCPLVNWLSGHYDFVNIASLGYCQTPILLFGFPLVNLANEDICTQDDPINTIYMYATIATACLILLALCASIYRRREALRCCRNYNRNYTYIDDNHFDINAHDRAAVRCPNPPNYGAVVGASAPAPAPAKPDEELPAYDDDVAPPDYEE